MSDAVVYVALGFVSGMLLTLVVLLAVLMRAAYLVRGSRWWVRE